MDKRLNLFGACQSSGDPMGVMDVQPSLYPMTFGAVLAIKIRGVKGLRFPREGGILGEITSGAETLDFRGLCLNSQVGVVERPTDPKRLHPQKNRLLGRPTLLQKAVIGLA